MKSCDRYNSRDEGGSTEQVSCDSGLASGFKRRIEPRARLDVSYGGPRRAGRQAVRPSPEERGWGLIRRCRELARTSESMSLGLSGDGTEIPTFGQGSAKGPLRFNVRH